MSHTEKDTTVQQAQCAEHVDPIKPAETVDTVHYDEAMKVLAAYSGDEEWTAAEEKRLSRKLDWKLLPVLCLTYMLQYYDKAMLSQAVSVEFPVCLACASPRRQADKTDTNLLGSFRAKD